MTLTEKLDRRASTKNIDQFPTSLIASEEENTYVPSDTYYSSIGLRFGSSSLWPPPCKDETPQSPIVRTIPRLVLFLN